MSNLVLRVDDGAVATLTLNRPERLNALDLEVAQAFRARVEAVAADSSVRCVVLAGAGRGFMAGGDVAAFAAAGDGVSALARAIIDEYHAATRALVGMDKPVLASLHGAVAGAGLSLAMAADLAVAAEGTVFTLAYAMIGTSPDGGATWFLPRLVGHRRAMELALLSDRIDAATALSLGLVNRVVPDAMLAGETAALAQRLAAGPTVAYAATKRLLRASAARDLSAQLDAERDSFVACAGTADFREGTSAFVAKRKPAFEGR